MFIQVKAFNLFNAVAGRKPSIDRLNLTKYNRKGKYYVGSSENGRFLQVNDGYRIRYYGNPFWNLYRIVSKNGNDFVNGAKSPGEYKPKVNQDIRN